MGGAVMTFSDYKPKHQKMTTTGLPAVKAWPAAPYNGRHRAVTR